MVRSFGPLYLRCTVRRTLCPLTDQISKTFMALIRFPHGVGTAATGTEKSETCGSLGGHRGRNPRCGNGLAGKTCVQRSGKAMSTHRQGGRHEGLKVQCKTGRLPEEH